MRLITAEDVANKLGVKPSWVHERTRKRCPESDRIPCIRLGKYVRFSEAEIDAWILRGCKPACRYRDRQS
jgi:predicted DNA-binding transcriptional regulator AlpA